MTTPVIINWNLASFTGWGVYGLNLALNWARDERVAAVAALPVLQENIVADPLRLLALQPFLARSLAFQATLKRYANGKHQTGVPLLTGFNHSAERLKAAHNVVLDGKPAIGVTFFEDGLDAASVARMKEFALVVTGSTWNEKVLRAYGVDRVRTVLQGIDPTGFHPAPGTGALRDRFLIFSGGKAELRKGQDIALAAFKVFAARHPEALLVTAWRSPWPQGARSLDRSGLAKPVVFNAAGQLDVTGWAAANGIPAGRVLDLGIIPNTFMPQVLHEMDAAVFPNRAEGGTNLVAMECMACGLPVVLSSNTGHLDLIEDGNCYPLLDQRQPGTGWHDIEGVPSWGESQVDEVVAQLERIFTDRTEAKRRGERAAQTLARLTWAETARRMADVSLGA